MTLHSMYEHTAHTAGQSPTAGIGDPRRVRGERHQRLHRPSLPADPTKVGGAGSAAPRAKARSAAWLRHSNEGVRVANPSWIRVQ